MSAIGPLLEQSSPAVKGVFVAALDLVRSVMPGATEQVDLPDRLIALGYGPPGATRMTAFAVALIPHRAHVNIQLADGAMLDDPDGLIEGTGKRIRHVKCRSLDDVGRPALRSILAEQVSRRSGEGK